MTPEPVGCREISVRLPEKTAVELAEFAEPDSPFPDYRNDLSALVTAILIDSRKRQGNLYLLLLDMKRTLERQRSQPPRCDDP